MKSKIDVIKAWKDPDYRASLTEEERALVAESPVGSAELENTLLDQVAGGRMQTADRTTWSAYCSIKWC